MLADLGHIPRLHDVEIRQQCRLPQSLLVSIFPEWLAKANIVADRTVANKGLLGGIRNRVDEPRLGGPISLDLTAIERDSVGGGPW